jgi:hypothetical protein
MSSAGSDTAGSDSGSSELDEFLQTMLADGNAMVGLILQQHQQRQALAAQGLLDDDGDDVDELVAAAAAGGRDYTPGELAPKQLPTYHWLLKHHSPVDDPAVMQQPPHERYYNKVRQRVCL